MRVHHDFGYDGRPWLAQLKTEPISAGSSDPSHRTRQCMEACPKRQGCPGAAFDSTIQTAFSGMLRSPSVHRAAPIGRAGHNSFRKCLNAFFSEKL